MTHPDHPDHRVQYALEKADGMSHRHPFLALIYRIVADVLSHPAQEEQEDEAA